LQAKVDELSWTSNDMKNLLDSTDIATLFLDDALLVRRFTPQTTKIIKLIPSDVGRSITDIVLAIDSFGWGEDPIGSHTCEKYNLYHESTDSSCSSA
jgi:hypothetical protein